MRQHDSFVFCSFISFLFVFTLFSCTSQSDQSGDDLSEHQTELKDSDKKDADKKDVFLDQPAIKREVEFDPEVERKILSMDLVAALKTLGFHGDYEERYENIIIPLCMGDVVIFDPASNPYYTEGDEVSDLCYYYIGTTQQNARLLRNVARNHKLIKDGNLIPGAASLWQVME